MGLAERLKELKNFRKMGKPSEGKSAAWSTRLLELSDAALLAGWEAARTDITTGPEFALGPTHHVPMDILKPEYQELLRRLKVGGHWLQLAYQKGRWVRDGRPRFANWGVVTDGVGTPWADWLDPEKFLGVSGPAKFDVVFCQEFRNSDFNWFDLLYRGTPDRTRP